MPHLVLVPEIPTSNDIVMDMRKTLPQQHVPYARSASGTECMIIIFRVLSAKLTNYIYDAYN